MGAERKIITFVGAVVGASLSVGVSAGLVFRGPNAPISAIFSGIPFAFIVAFPFVLGSGLLVALPLSRLLKSHRVRNPFLYVSIGTIAGGVTGGVILGLFGGLPAFAVGFVMGLLPGLTASSFWWLLVVRNASVPELEVSS